MAAALLPEGLSEQPARHTSCMANFSPMQRRGPTPKGIHAHGWRALSSAESGRNRSGRNACSGARVL